MSKMSIAEAAEYFGVSKEAIHNRIRRGSLQSVVEDGIKLVLIEKGSPKANTKKAQIKATNIADERYYKLLQEQNAKLQDRVEKLENETRTLRDQKEQMLIEERIKIEEIYKQKDEQLKNILSAISSKFMLNAPTEMIQESEHVEAEIEFPLEEEEQQQESVLISLKKYLKEQKYSKKKQEKIKAKFKKIAKEDTRVIMVGKKCYIDLGKYDYSDLL